MQTRLAQTLKMVSSQRCSDAGMAVSWIAYVKQTGKSPLAGGQWKLFLKFFAGKHLSQALPCCCPEPVISTLIFTPSKEYNGCGHSCRLLDSAALFASAALHPEPGDGALLRWHHQLSAEEDWVEQTQCFWTLPGLFWLIHQLDGVWFHLPVCRPSSLCKRVKPEACFLIRFVVRLLADYNIQWILAKQLCSLDASRCKASVILNRIHDELWPMLCIVQCVGNGVFVGETCIHSTWNWANTQHLCY